MDNTISDGCFLDLIDASLEPVSSFTQESGSQHESNEADGNNQPHMDEEEEFVTQFTRNSLELTTSTSFSGVFVTESTRFDEFIQTNEKEKSKRADAEDINRITNAETMNHDEETAENGCREVIGVHSTTSKCIDAGAVKTHATINQTESLDRSQTKNKSSFAHDERELGQDENNGTDGSIEPFLYNNTTYRNVIDLCEVIMKAEPSGDEPTHQVPLDDPCQNLTQETVVDVDFSGTISGVSEQHVQIRNKISNILQQIELHINQGTPLVTRRRLSWQDCSMESGMLQCTSLSQELKKGKRVAKHRLLLIVRMLATIYQLLTTGTSCTKREFYYLHLDLAQTPACCYAALTDACALLEVDAWEVNVFNTAKGLVAGPLLLTLDSGQTIDCCSARWGTSVPLNVASITKLQCTAKVVLVVEKDTVFKRLLEDGIVETCANTVLLVTAKGYPDVSTRLLLRKIVESVDIPVCGLMDADPHGMEIFCVYKFGSLAMAHRQQPLAIPTMRWIGLFASDIEVLGLQSVPLRDLELKKIDHMIKRPYAEGMLKHELLLLRQLAVKAEIESLLHITSDFITRVYIKKKLEECIAES